MERVTLSTPFLGAEVTLTTGPTTTDHTDHTDHQQNHHTLPRFMASLHFCSECNNMLYPKADQQRRVMVFACRICDYDEIAENKCVYRNDLLTVTKEQVGVTTDLGSDPTLPHSTDQTCPNCGNQDAVYFQDQSKRRETRMILFYVCKKCNHAFTDPNMQTDVRAEE